MSIGTRCCVLDRLRDSESQATGIVGIFGKGSAARSGVGTGAGNTLSSPGFHHHLAVGFLLVTYFNHIHFEINAELAAGKSHRGTPLAGSGLGSKALDTLFFVVVSLGHSGVGLMAACRA